MKLLFKSTLWYFFISVIVFSAGILIFRYSLRNILVEEASEYLHLRKELFTDFAAKHDSLPQLSVFNFDKVSIKPVAAPVQEYEKDTLMYNELEEEVLPYRILVFSLKTSSGYYKASIAKLQLETDDLMEAVTTAAIIVFSILLVSLLVIGGILSGSLWKPFRSTMEKLRNYDVKKGENFTPEKTTIHEFRILNETLSKMTERIMSDYRNMKEFTENASHELQTPLAVISSRLEQLMQSGGLSEEQAAFINSCRESVSRLSKINQALLLMSKIENRQFNNSEMSNLSLMIKQKLESLAELISFKELKAETDTEPGVLVKLPNALADVMLNNLFNNAIRHTEKGSEIKILLRKNKMVFSNPGEPLPIPNEEIFRRFKKGSDAQESTGLGLAIVKQVCDAYNIKVSYSYSGGNHFFEFDF